MVEESSQLKRKYQPPKQIFPEHQEFMLRIGLKLQLLRTERKISASGLAKELGISRNAYRMMEEGKVYFNFISLMQILDYHRISPSDFFSELKNDM